MCMYVYVSACIRMYLYVSCVYLHAYTVFIKYTCPKSLHVYVCMCMYMYVLAYMCIHVYICRPHTGHIYSFMCRCPQQARNIPGGGPATSGPHSGRPWAAALPLYPEIREPPPDPFWRTFARCTRRKGERQPPCAAHGPSTRKELHGDSILSHVCQ